MFTGIITHKATLITSDKGTLTVSCPFDSYPTIGQSIAHDGACMSVTQIDKQTKTYSFFAMQESFDKTNFSSKKPGDTFNIELCMQAGDRLDGHFVTGHIDTRGTITHRSYADDSSLKLTIGFDAKRNKFLLPKGSVAVNGISLTVVDLTEDSFTIWLIPITQEDTNLGSAMIGDSVNLEFDMLGKYVLKSQGIQIQ